MTSDRNPWDSISKPDRNHFQGKRVDAHILWDFFWALDVDELPMLLLNIDPDATATVLSMPKLNGIEIELLQTPSKHTLLFRLLDINHRDIFHELCLDIIASTSSALTEAEALKQSLQRTWRWHYLLRGGSSGLLSEMEQKGLIGELFALEQFILESFAPGVAVSCWTGPDGAPKDFECGEVCIEIKTRRGTARPFVKISSEDQLDTESNGRLILFVLDVTRAVLPNAINPCLTDIAARAKAMIESTDHVASDKFDQKLLGTGFRWEDDYGDYRWIIGSHSFFDVTEDFPRITRHNLMPGISHVEYALSLDACSSHQIDDDVVLHALQGVPDAS